MAMANRRTRYRTAGRDRVRQDNARHKTRFIVAKKTNNKLFIQYFGSMRRRFGRSTVIGDNTAHHKPRHVRKYLERSNNFVKLTFL